MRVKKILMRVKKILMHPRKNTADNLTFNVESANGDPEAVDKLVEVQKNAQGNPPAERPRVGALKTSDAGALKTPVSK